MNQRGGSGWSAGAYEGLHRRGGPGDPVNTTTHYWDRTTESWLCEAQLASLRLSRRPSPTVSNSDLLAEYDRLSTLAAPPVPPNVTNATISNCTDYNATEVRTWEYMYESSCTTALPIASFSSGFAPPSTASILASRRGPAGHHYGESEETTWDATHYRHYANEDYGDPPGRSPVLPQEIPIQTTATPLVPVAGQTLWSAARIHCGTRNISVADLPVAGWHRGEFATVIPSTENPIEDIGYLFGMASIQDAGANRSRLMPRSFSLAFVVKPAAAAGGGDPAGGGGGTSKLAGDEYLGLTTSDVAECAPALLSSVATAAAATAATSGGGHNTTLWVNFFANPTTPVVVAQTMALEQPSSGEQEGDGAFLGLGAASGERLLGRRDITTMYAPVPCSSSSADIRGQRIMLAESVEALASAAPFDEAMTGARLSINRLLNSDQFVACSKLADTAALPGGAAAAAPAEGVTVELPITRHTARCLASRGSRAFGADPCCNETLGRTMCCAAEQRTLEYRATTPAPPLTRASRPILSQALAQCGASVQVDRSVRAYLQDQQRVVLPGSGCAASARRDGDRRRLKYYEAFLHKCLGAVFPYAGTDAAADQGLECATDAECLTQCQPTLGRNGKVAMRCEKPYDDPRRGLFKCFQLYMEPDLAPHFYKLLGVSALDDVATQRAAFDQRLAPRAKEECVGAESRGMCLLPLNVTQCHYTTFWNSTYNDTELWWNSSRPTPPGSPTAFYYLNYTTGFSRLPFVDLEWLPGIQACRAKQFDRNDLAAREACDVLHDTMVKARPRVPGQQEPGVRWGGVQRWAETGNDGEVTAGGPLYVRMQTSLAQTQDPRTGNWRNVELPTGGGLCSNPHQRADTPSHLCRNWTTQGDVCRVIGTCNVDPSLDRQTCGNYSIHQSLPYFCGTCEGGRCASVVERPRCAIYDNVTCEAVRGDYNVEQFRFDENGVATTRYPWIPMCTLPALADAPPRACPEDYPTVYSDLVLGDTCCSGVLTCNPSAGAAAPQASGACACIPKKKPGIPQESGLADVTNCPFGPPYRGCSDYTLPKNHWNGDSEWSEATCIPDDVCPRTTRPHDERWRCNYNKCLLHRDKTLTHNRTRCERQRGGEMVPNGFVSYLGVNQSVFKWENFKKEAAVRWFEWLPDWGGGRGLCEFSQMRLGTLANWTKVTRLACENQRVVDRFFWNGRAFEQGALHTKERCENNGTCGMDTAVPLTSCGSTKVCSHMCRVDACVPYGSLSTVGSPRLDPFWKSLCWDKSAISKRSCLRLSRTGAAGENAVKHAVIRWEPSLQRCLHLDAWDYDTCTLKGPSFAFFACSDGNMTGTETCEGFRNSTADAMAEVRYIAMNGSLSQSGGTGGGPWRAPMTSRTFLRCQWVTTARCPNKRDCEARGSCNDHSLGKPGSITVEGRGGKGVSSAATGAAPLWPWYDGGRIEKEGAAAAMAVGERASSRRVASTANECVDHGQGCQIDDALQPWTMRRWGTSPATTTRQCELCGHRRWRPYNVFKPATYAAPPVKKFKWMKRDFVAVNTWHGGEEGAAPAFRLDGVTLLVKESIRQMFVARWVQELRCAYEHKIGILAGIACACGVGREAGETDASAEARCFSPTPIPAPSGIVSPQQVNVRPPTPPMNSPVASVLLLPGFQRSVMESLFAWADVRLSSPTAAPAAGTMVEMFEVAPSQFENHPSRWEPMARNMDHVHNLTLITRSALTRINHIEVPMTTWAHQVELERVFAQFTPRCFPHEVIRNSAGVVVGQLVGSGVRIRTGSDVAFLNLTVAAATTTTVLSTSGSKISTSSSSASGGGVDDDKGTTVTAKVCVFPNPEIEQCGTKYPALDFAVGGTDGKPKLPMQATVDVNPADGRWCVEITLPAAGGEWHEMTVYPIRRKVDIRSQTCEALAHKWHAHDCSLATDGRVTAEPVLARLCRADCMVHAVDVLSESWLSGCPTLRRTLGFFVWRYDAHCFEAREALEQQWYDHSCMAAADRVLAVEAAASQSDMYAEGLLCNATCSVHAQTIHAKAILGAPHHHALLELSVEQFLVMQARRCCSLGGTHKVLARIALGGYTTATLVDAGRTEIPLAFRVALAGLVDVAVPAVSIIESFDDALWGATRIRKAVKGRLPNAMPPIHTGNMETVDVRWSPDTPIKRSVAGRFLCYTFQWVFDGTTYDRQYGEQCQYLTPLEAILPELKPLASGKSRVGGESGGKLGIVDGSVAYFDVQIITRSKDKATRIADELRLVTQDATIQAKYAHEVRTVGARHTSHVFVTGIVVDEVWRHPNDPPPVAPQVTWIPITMQKPTPRPSAAGLLEGGGEWGGVGGALRTVLYVFVGAGLAVWF